VPVGVAAPRGEGFLVEAVVAERQRNADARSLPGGGVEHVGVAPDRLEGTASEGSKRAFDAFTRAGSSVFGARDGECDQRRDAPVVVLVERLRHFTVCRQVEFGEGVGRRVRVTGERRVDECRGASPSARSGTGTATPRRRSIPASSAASATVPDSSPAAIVPASARVGSGASPSSPTASNAVTLDGLGPRQDDVGRRVGVADGDGQVGVGRASRVAERTHHGRLERRPASVERPGEHARRGQRIAVGAGDEADETGLTQRVGDVAGGGADDWSRPVVDIYSRSSTAVS